MASENVTLSPTYLTISYTNGQQQQQHKHLTKSESAILFFNCNELRIYHIKIYWHLVQLSDLYILQPFLCQKVF